MKQFFIGEVKTQSPFGYKTRYLWWELFLKANDIADMISIHTDPRWGGAMCDIEAGREATKKPILAKGIHDTDDEVRRALNAGADYVLVVGRLPHRNLRAKCFVEPYSIAQLKSFSGEAERFVWNSRDLFTGGLKTETWEEARQCCDQLIQASNIKTRADVKPDAQAFIVGESLMTFC